MSSEPSNADVLDAVAMELSRFSQEVVTEVHRLRDDLGAAQARVQALEADVAELRERASQSPERAALPIPNGVDMNNGHESDADAFHPEAPTPPLDEPRSDIAFAPLTLSLEPVERIEPPTPAAADAGLDDLVARVLDEVSEPLAVSWPADS